MGLRSSIVNFVARHVRFDRLHVRELLVGDSTIVLDGNGVLFTTLVSDPAAAPAGKARLAAVNGALRRSASAGAWQNA